MGDFLQERDLILKISRRIAEVMRSEDFHKQCHEAIDPTVGDAAAIPIRGGNLRRRVFQDILDEFDVTYTGENVNMLNRDILQIYQDDKEVGI